MRITPIVCSLLLIGALEGAESKPERHLTARLPMPFLNTTPQPALDAAEQKLVRESIHSFDSDSYQARERAVEQLVELGPRVLPLLGRIYTEISTSNSFGPEVELRWEQTVATIRSRELSDRYAATIAAIQETRKDGGAQPMSSASFLGKLRAPVKHLQASGDLNDAVAALEQVTGVPIAVDPELIGNTASGDWTWEQQSVASILDELCRQCEAAWRPYRGAVVIGFPDRIAELANRRIEIRLPAPRNPSEPPWTMKETQDWINALSPALPQDDQTPGLFLDVPPRGHSSVRVRAPGLVEMEGDEFQLASMLELVSSNPQLTLRERLPEVRELVRILDAPVGEQFKGAFVQQVIGKRCPGSPADCNPFLQAAETAPASCEDANQSFGAWLETATKENWCHAFPCIRSRRPAILGSFQQDESSSPGQLLVFYCVDLKEARSKGIPHAQLTEALRGILSESPFWSTAHRIRDRWVGYADFWTVLRMETFVASIGHNDEYRMPPPPELPWFIKELCDRR